MLGLTATPKGRAVHIATRSGDWMEVTEPVDGELVPTTMSRLKSVRLASPAAHDWLSYQLERPVRLAWLDDPRRRSVSEAHGGLPGDSLTVADAGPLLLTSNASLRQLNDWMDPRGDIEMARFRPNVVVDDVAEPFEEDRWRRIQIGESEFRFAEICDRCVMTTLDPQTLAGGKEPLRTLAKRRQWDHKTWFGIRLIPVSATLIRVGDKVEVLTRESEASNVRRR